MKSKDEIRDMVIGARYYAPILTQLSDKQAGRLLKGLCEHEVFGADVTKEVENMKGPELVLFDLICADMDDSYFRKLGKK